MRNIDNMDVFGFEEAADEYKRQASLLIWGVIIILIGIVFSFLSEEIVSGREEVVAEYNEIVLDMSMDDFFGNHTQTSNTYDYERAKKLKMQIQVYDFLAFMGEKGCYILMFVGGIMIISAQIRRVNEK